LLLLAVLLESADSRPMRTRANKFDASTRRIPP